MASVRDKISLISAVIVSARSVRLAGESDCPSPGSGDTTVTWQM